ncbi:MAG: hypothetical protein C0467_07135 [Planctomycetaceae bacterium]|nr:hypothetical protein [Planctomycetaceae bacterium]
MPFLFAATLFVSASLLFMVQPMVGKMVLPLLGGSPAVWNACMVFFQALLLLGYLYAHKLSDIQSPRKQWMIHLLVLALPLGVFALAAVFSARHTPIAILESLAPTDERSPIVSVLLILTVAIGIPFFVISTTATLLQKWFVFTGHPSARDPYFLYSASNFGSLISLLGYPLLIEPRMTIAAQAWVFAGGFALLVGLIYFCGRSAANPIGVPPAPGQSGKNGVKPEANKETSVPATLADTTPPSLARKLKWILLAFVPSTLMLGVTFHMTTDIASVPLLWVGPLALYLITFIIAFGRVPDWFRMVIGNFAPVMILLLVFVLISGVDPGHGVKLILHMLTFFAAALMCHYELARDRPAPQYLTGFFLLMSLGGVLGGVFNALVAPLVFPHPYEYPIALIIACLMVPKLLEDKDAPPVTEKRRKIGLALDVAIPVVVGFAFYYLAKLPGKEWYGEACVSIAKTIHLSVQTVNVVMIYAVPVMLCFFFVDRPFRFALCVAAILGPLTIRESEQGLVHSERSFFGILKISESDYGSPLRNPRNKDFVFKHENGEDAGKEMIAMQVKMRQLHHGTTLHGTQYAYFPDELNADGSMKMGGKLRSRHVLDDFQIICPNITPWEMIATTATIQAYDIRQEPLTYYHQTGPVGAMFAELWRRKGGTDAKAHFAMVGLGTGSVSCYARPGQNLTYYEIDPAVKHIVADTNKYFTYVTDAQDRGAKLDLRMGDARLKLKEATDQKYSLLLVDAFSSDSIPVHLLTVEAVKLYLERMTDDGMLAMHISNRWLNLEPVVSRIAGELGLTARVWNDNSEGRRGKTASSWVVLARKPEHLGQLYSPVGDLIFNPPAELGKDDRMKVSMEYQLFQALAHEFDDLRETGVKKAKYIEMNELPADKVNAAWIAWAKERQEKTSDPAMKQRLAQYIDLMERHSPFVTFQEAMVRDHGHAFRRLETMAQVPAWTDDYADVMGVMTIPEVQRVRSFFGLPNPLKRHNTAE